MNKIITLALGMALAMPMLAQIPQTLSFQGYLTSDAGEPITTETGSPLSVSFSLYNAASGGSLVWGPEPQTIEVDRGIFNTVLGSIEPLNIDANAPYFLQITIGAEDLPRIAVTSGLYSLSTSNAENITSNQLAIANGGTNAANAADARTNLDAQQADAGLSSIAGLTTVADQMLYLDGSDSYATTSLTAFGRELLDDVDAAAAQASLGLAVGANVQAFDAGLSSIAGLTTSTDQMIYTDGSDSYTTSPLTGYARSILDDADEATFKSTVNLETGTDIQAFDAGLQSISGLTTSANQLIFTTASNTYATTSLTSFARMLLDDGSATTARNTLGLVIGTNVQAQDADLDDLADDGSLSGSRVSPVFGAQTITTTAGLHVGGTSNPGTDNAIVDGTLRIGENGSPSTTLEVVHADGNPVGGDGLTITGDDGGGNRESWSLYTVPSNGNLILYSGTNSRGFFNSTSGAYTATSDRRIKKNIDPLESVLDDVIQIPTYRYHFKHQSSDEEKEIGIIAQELKKIFPSFVEYSKPEDMHSVNYAGLSVITIRAIQEQQAIIESLKDEITVLRDQLAQANAKSRRLDNKITDHERKIEMLFRMINKSHANNQHTSPISNK